MFGIHKVKYHMRADLTLQIFENHQKSVFEVTGNIVVITKVPPASYDITIIYHKTVKPKDGPAKEPSEARKHINNAKIILGA